MHRPSGTGLPAVACAVINDGAGGRQHQSGVDRFLLAIRSRRSLQDQEANFRRRLGILIGGMSLDTLPPEDWAPTRLAKMSVGKRTVEEVSTWSRKLPFFPAITGHFSAIAIYFAEHD
jgi:hypothetical protein